MPATNYTPIILYHSTTASAAPVAGNLNNGELAINITDGKLYYKDNGGNVQVLATQGTGTIGGSNTQVQYNSSGSLAGSSNLTFDGTTLTANQLALTTVLDETYGGTGLNAYTTGDLIYASGSNTLGKLSIGTSTYILTSTGSVPQWSAPSSVTVATANNLAGGAAGSVPYQTGSGVTTFLSIGTQNQVVTSTGTAPQWSSSLTLVDLIVNGNTTLGDAAGDSVTINAGTTTFSQGTANGVAYLDGSKVLTTGSALTWNGSTLLVGGNTRFGSGAVIPGFATASDASLANNASLRGTNAAGSTAFELIKFNTSDQVVINNDGADAVITSAATSARWNVGGGEQMRLTSAGLGIGTSSPARKLDVVDNGNINATSAISNSTAGTSSLARFLAVSDAGSAVFGMTSSSYTDIPGAQDAMLLNANSASGGIAFTLDGVLRMNLDSSGNLGLGVTPSAWSSLVKAFETSGGSLYQYNGSTLGVVQNAYYDGAWKYKNTAGASNYFQSNSVHYWNIAPSGTAGNTISFTQAMTLDASGFLGIGQTSPISLIDVYGNGAYTYARFWRSDEAGYGGRVGNGNTLLGAAPARSLGLDGYSQISFGIAGSQVAVIDSSGNVGIGTSSPAYKLDVADASSGIRIGSNVAGYRFYREPTGGNAGFLQFYGSQSGYTGYIFGGVDGERARIDSSGNVGIGTSSPVGRLSVIGSDNTTQAVFSGAIGTTGRGLRIATSLIASNNEGAILDAQATTGSATLIFQIASTERARIDSSGNLLVGATVPAGSERLNVTKDIAATEIVRFYPTNATDPYGLLVYYLNANPNGTSNEFIGCYSSGGTKRMTVQSNGGIANYSANNVNLSDRREKTNFAPAGSYLDKICAIPVQTFNYIDQNLEKDAGLTLGVVAQDVQAVAPELVMESNWAAKDEEAKMRLSIYQTDLQYALMKCIQEQQAIIDSLKARLDAANL